LSDFSDFKEQIKEFANRQDWSDTLTTSFVRAAEQKCNAEMRIARMIQTEQSTIASRCAPLPPDWLEMILVRIASSSAADGWTPIRYKPQDEFFRTTATDETIASAAAWNAYTIVGSQIYFGGAPNTVDGTVYKIAYYGEVPVFSDTQDSWLYDKYPSLYLYAALMHADLHAIGEEQSAANMKTLAEDMIQKLNNEHMRSRASGSRLTRTRVRSFG
jgi:hypothetical protein